MKKAELHKAFREVFNSKPPKTRDRIAKTIQQVCEDYRHPSLQARRLRGSRDTFYARVSLGDRLTYEVRGDVVFFKVNCSHQQVLGT